MKALIIVSLFALKLNTIECVSSGSQKQNKVEKFNYRRYKAFKAKKKDKDTSNEGIVISYYEDDNVYQEELKQLNSTLTVNKIFYKDNLALKSEVSLFLGMAIGVEKQYDHTGHLLKTTDYEAPFTFSLQNLTYLLKDHYNLDLYTSKNFGIWRYNNLQTAPYYEIHIFYDAGIFKILRVNGINGKVIFDTNSYLTR